MSEPSSLPSQTISRYYRQIRSSPSRMLLVIVFLLLLVVLVFLAVRFVALQNRSLALLNWLNLLLIPLFLVIAGVWLTQAWRRTQFELARLRDERAMAEAYYDRLTNLLLERNLRQASPDDEVARAARAHTLALLRELDGKGRGQIIRNTPEGTLVCATEPRADGCVAAW